VTPEDHWFSSDDLSFTRAHAGDASSEMRVNAEDYHLPAPTRVTRIYDRIDLKGQPFTRAHEGGAD
jgi:RecA-family ATPase